MTLDPKYLSNWDGPSVRAVRHALGLTQQNFSHLLGVTQPTVSLWEKHGVVGTAAMVLYYLAADCTALPDGRALPGPATRTAFEARGLDPSSHS